MSDWKSRALPVSNDWKSRAEIVAPEVSTLESLGRGVFQGATMGFGDEGTGALEALWDKMSGDDKAKTFTELYRMHRDEARSKNKAAEEANPKSYIAGQFGGGLSTALIPGLGEMNMTKMAGLGATQALGDSESDSVGGDLKNAAKGALIGAATHGVIDNVLKPAISKAPEFINKGLSKLGSFATGADEDALLRNIERPAQMAAAEADGFGNQVSSKAMDEISGLGEQLGKNVGSAKDAFLKTQGSTEIPGFGNDIAENINSFLSRNEPSQKGFSGLSEKQMGELKSLEDVFKGGQLNGEDLVKGREYLDNVEKLASKYDQEGTSPFVRFLKGLRHDLDSKLDTISPEVNSANTRYSDFLNDKKVLGLNNESTAESVVNNLYGQNKTAKQLAAQNLLTPNTMEQIQDIAANKAISNAKGPAGSEYGARRMGAHLMAGFGLAHGNLPMAIASEAVVSPQVWKQGLRTLGTVEQKISYLLDKAPDVLGKYAPVLKNANLRGPAALSATQFLLQQNDPEYRQVIKQIHEEGN